MAFTKPPKASSQKHNQQTETWHWRRNGTVDASSLASGETSESRQFIPSTTVLQMDSDGLFA